MPKKTKKYNIDDEIIIGYNTKNVKDKPSKNNKTEKNNRSKKKKGKKIKKILLTILKVLLSITIIVGIAVFLFISPVFNITQIRVENAEKISENTYIVLSELEIGQNIFRISKSKIEQSIKQESYVEKIEVKREYPGTIVLVVQERKPEYMLEYNGLYVYIDKNGYILETNPQALEIPIIKGTCTDLENTKQGERINEEDLTKFNDLIKIIDGLKNNNIQTKITSIDIADDSNYILEFNETGKKVLLGDTSNLSTKMLWIKYFMDKGEIGRGTIHLQKSDNVYFEPERNENASGEGGQNG